MFSCLNHVLFKNQKKNKEIKEKNKTFKITRVVSYRAFSHDVTAAILVFQNNETADMLVFQTNLVES